MEAFFRIELLPACQGDAIWIEYGNSGTTRRILIDAGPIDAFPDIEARLKKLKDGDRRVEAAIITHVDTDHIEGIIRLLIEKKNKWLIAPEDIWFNGYKHMEPYQILGGREGDFLSAIIQQRAPEKWNCKFDNKAIVVDYEQDLPVAVLEDNMKITILSPDKSKLKSMAKKWGKDVKNFGCNPGDLEKAWKQLLKQTKYMGSEGILGSPGEIDESLLKQLKTDQSAANGSCIAFLAEFEGKSCLFLGDAHAPVIVKSLKKLLPKGQKRIKVDAVKVSHHGSKSNISKSLMNLIDARHFLISTNGAKHDHPDAPAIETIIQGSLQDPELWFNYKSEQTLIWKKNPDNLLRPYTTHFPSKKTGGIILDLFKE